MSSVSPISPPHTLANLLYAIVFALLILGPATAAFWHRDGDWGEIGEKWNAIAERSLGEAFDLEKFRREFEALFGKYFGFRTELVRMNALATIGLFGESPAKAVVIGREGWLFYALPGQMDDFRGLRPFDEDELDLWAAALESRREYLAERGIAYLFVIAPNKHVIYPELLPEKFNRLSSETHTDALLATLDARQSTVEVLDLHPSQTRAREEATAYYPLDTHWNYFGAYHGYLAIMKRLEKLLPGTRALEPDRFAWEEDWNAMYGLNEHMGILGKPEQKIPYRKYVIRNPTASFVMEQPDGIPELPGVTYGIELQHTYRITHSSGEKPRALVFRDSFSIALVPLLAEHFSEMVLVWEEFDPELFERAVDVFKPDIVIEERLDRFLQHRPPMTADISGRRFRAAFEGAEEVALEIDGSRGVRRFKKGAVVLEITENGTRLVPTSKAARIDLPQVELKKGEVALLKMSLSRRTATTGRLEWRVSMKKTRERETEGLDIWIPEGESDLYLAIPAATSEGKVRFRFRPFSRDEMTVRHAEVRKTTEPVPQLGPERVSPYAP